VFGVLTDTGGEEAALEPTPSTTPSPTVQIDLETFTVDQIAVGQPFDWQSVLSVEEGMALPLVTHGDWTYLFTVGEESSDESGDQLSAWRSRDGVSWDDLGTVLVVDGHVRAVVATPQGLVAIEETQEGGLSMRRSPDGAAWDTEAVPVSNGAAGVNLLAVGGTDRLIAVAAYETSGGEDLIENGLENAGHDPALALHWGVENVGDDFRFTFYGPLGLAVLTLTGSEMGLTQTEIDQIHEGSGEQEASVWTSVDGGDFVATTVDDAGWIDTFTPAPDGSLLAFGWGNGGAGIWKSWDGTIWEQVASGLYGGVGTARMWDGRLFGPPTNVGGVGLLDSFDGSNWNEVGDLAQRFPPQIQWTSSNLGVGGAGLVLTAEGFRDRPQPELSRQPTVITRDGYTLSLDLVVGMIGLSTPSGATGSWPVWGVASPPGLEVDPKTQTVRLGVGEETVEWTFDELTEAEAVYWGEEAWQYSPEHFALIFTSDAENWSIADLGDLLADGSLVSSLGVTEDRVVVLTVSAPQESEGGAGGLQIWAAPVA
jgi:hypothetical protein